MIEPFIKWAGGKRRLLDTLRPLVLEGLCEGGTYWEPFLGAGAVALSLPREVPVVASDVNAELMGVWDAVRRSPYQLIRDLRAMAAKHSPDFYYQVRDEWELESNEVGRAARFIYLNKTGFNGLYRKNKSGKFNVPLGRGRASSIPDTAQLIPVFDRIRNWRLESLDFEDLLEDKTWRPSEGDVVYCDPPYDGTQDYSTGFGEDDQRRLAAVLRRAARRGVRVIATNSDTPLIRELYRWAELRRVREPRLLSCKARERADARCVLVVR